MHTLNSWILAPADAGKTSPTGRPLFAAYGKIRTDSPTHERQRGTTTHQPVVVSLLLDIEDDLDSVNPRGTHLRRGPIAVRAAGPLAQVKRTDVPRQKALVTHD